MNFNIELILFYATIVTGVIVLLNRYFKLQEKHAVLRVVVDYAKSFFPVLFLVFLLRSFLYEPFRIPSGSLEPTLLTGDFIVVNKFDYGIRLPVAHKKIYQTSDPKRGDIIVFRWPANPSINFVKRVVGLPGDKISYVDKQLTINGVKITQSTLPTSGSMDAEERIEDLMGVKHHIYVHTDRPSADYKEIVVPKGMYFVMGDNRDNSEDSRYWGFVPDENIVGKAVLVWLSWNGVSDGSKWDYVRWKRFGNVIR